MLGLRSKQNGDTIIEVLIAISIVSLVLVTAYGISNRNTLEIEATQEQEQAQHLVESQIESLRTAGQITLTPTAGECFDGTTETQTCDNFSADGSGATYKVTITGPLGPSTLTPRVYTITATWTSLTGKTNNDGNVTMYYRLN